MSDRDAKGNENVIPAKAGIQKTKELDSRLHGNDGLEVFSGEKTVSPWLVQSCKLNQIFEQGYWF